MQENFEKIDKKDKQYKKERVVLVGVHTDSRDKLNDSNEQTLDELALLAETAGGEVVGCLLQNRPKIDVATYVGEGKLEELAEFVRNNEIDVVIFDDELSGSQIRNIEEVVKTRVIDRALLILDIFALHAHTRAGKIQVELAQMQYMLPRLTGLGEQMSRLGGGSGGGIGARRGAGETKLEIDRRHIRSRIASLRKELEEVEKNRTVQRAKRTKDMIPIVALIGYTNAGKSSVLNYYTDAGVLAEDKLFATLDPIARKFKLPNNQDIILVDTVGFIRKLPHHLVESFKSTLEEVKLADILINVYDLTDPNLDLQMEVVNGILLDLEVQDKPTLNVFNKVDIYDGDDILGKTCVSAKTGQGMDKLIEQLIKELEKGKTRVNLCIPFNRGELVSLLHEKAKIFKEEFEGEGVSMDVLIDSSIFSQVKDFIRI